MPMEAKRYPANWKQIAREKKDSTGWCCEFCGKQCRKPGEPFDTHTRTLTVAHMNHIPEDCRPENLRALCAPCHLRYDASHHAQTRRERKQKMKTERIIELLKTEQECVSRDCDRDCARCDLVQTEEELTEMYTLAIEMVQRRIPQRPEPMVMGKHTFYICRGCKNTIRYMDNFCGDCGQAVTWG